MVKFTKSRGYLPSHKPEVVECDRLAGCKLIHKEPYLLQSLQTYLSPALKEVIKHGVRQSSYVQFQKNRITAPHKDGFLTNSDDAYFALVKDLYNTCVAHGIVETRILNDPGKVQPFPGDARPMADFKDTNEYTKDEIFYGREYMSMYYSKSFSHFDIAKAKLTAKQNTTCGGWRIDRWGSSYTADKVSFGKQIVMDKQSVMKYGKRYTPIKKQRINQQLTIKAAYDQFFSDSFEDVLKKLNFYLTNNIVNMYSCGYRLNQVDPDVSGLSTYYKDQLLYPKRRTVNVMVQNSMHEYEIQSEQWCKYLSSQFGNGLLPKKDRTIFNGNYATNGMFQLYARCLMQGLEESAWGMVANRPEIKDRYKQFCDAPLGDQWLFIQADRTNSDRYISTNADSFVESWPTKFQNFVKKAMLGVSCMPDGIYVTYGVNSGSWATTLFTSHKGRLTSNLILTRGLGLKYKDIIEADRLSIFNNNQPWSTVGDYHILRYMDTDDLLIVVRSNKPISYKDPKIYKLKIETSTDGVDSFFGFSFNHHFCKEDSTAHLAKIINPEPSAWYTRELFSLFMKLEEVRRLYGPEMFKSIMSVVSKHTLITYQDLADSEKQFFHDLHIMGLSVSDVFNVYSPKEVLWLGEALRKDDDSITRLDLQTVHRIDDVINATKLVSEWLS